MALFPHFIPPSRYLTMFVHKKSGRTKLFPCCLFNSILRDILVSIAHTYIFLGSVGLPESSFVRSFHRVELRSRRGKFAERHNTEFELSWGGPRKRTNYGERSWKSFRKLAFPCCRVSWQRTNERTNERRESPSSSSLFLPKEKKKKKEGDILWKLKRTNERTSPSSPFFSLLP